MPDLPSIHAGVVLGLTVVALGLFTSERIPLQMSSLVLLVVLTALFELFPYPGVDAVELFHGFGHEALVAVCALMVAGQGLVRTGALEPVGRYLARAWARSPSLSFLLTLLVGAVFSAFVNNTPIVVLLLPILVSVCLKTGVKSNEVLMPMGFATLIGGMATTIGTSTNLLVVSVAHDLGLERMSMFEFALPAAIAAGVGIVYLWLIAPRLLPERHAGLESESPRLFVAALRVPEDTFADGAQLRDLYERVGREFRVISIRRGEDAHIMPLPDVMIRAGDFIRIEDTPANLKEIEQSVAGELFSGDRRVEEASSLRDESQQLAEIAVVQGSPVVGLRLERAQFRSRYGVMVLAAHRAGIDVLAGGKRLADVTLQPGDVLLVQGSKKDVAALKSQHQLLVLDAMVDLPKTDRAWLASTIMAGIVIVAAAGIMTISVAATAGAMLMLATRCLSWREAIQALSPPVIFVVVASLALGSALLATGGTDYLTAVFLVLTDGATPAMTLSGLMLLMAALTNIVSNNAAAIIGTPIAIGIAESIGAPPIAFVLAVLFGANMSYATPMAYKTNLLVMSAGGYRFSDFLRVGVPLTLLMWITFSFVLPWLYF